MLNNKFYVLISIISVITMLTSCFISPSKDVLRIGVCEQVPPYIFYDSQTNLQVGFNVDLAEEIARRLHKRLEINTYSFSKLIFAVKSNQIDCAFNMNITPERKKVVDFTIPIYITRGQVIVNSENSDIKSFDDIIKKKITIGIRNGTVYTLMLKEKYNIDSSLVKIFPTFGDLKIAIERNMVDSAVDDYAAMYHLKSKEGIKIKLIKKVLNETPSAIIVDKDNKEFLAQLNKALKDIIEDGTYDKIARKWFGMNPLTEKPPTQ